MVPVGMPELPAVAPRPSPSEEVRDPGPDDAPERGPGEAGQAREGRERYVLRLYVTGITPKSLRAVANLRRICDAYLKGRYVLEVVDLYQDGAAAAREAIIAAPTLVKELPPPLRRLIGDLSDTRAVLVGLSLEGEEEA